jgi:hypothetical protein
MYDKTLETGWQNITNREFCKGDMCEKTNLDIFDFPEINC